MVGTAKWKDEWVAHIFHCKRTDTSMSNKDIADSLRARYPRTKDFNAGGVKYVLANFQDATYVILSYTLAYLLTLIA